MFHLGISHLWYSALQLRSPQEQVSIAMADVARILRDDPICVSSALHIPPLAAYGLERPDFLTR